jgi:hypothetical protein
VITNTDFLKVFHVNEPSCTVGELWKHIADKVLVSPSFKKRKQDLQIILNNGTLSTRMLRALNDDYSAPALLHVYRKLAECLEENRLFIK